MTWQENTNFEIILKHVLLHVLHGSDVRVKEIKSFVSYFFGIVGIVWFCDFVIFPSYRNILILQSCTMFSRIVQIFSHS